MRSNAAKIALPAVILVGASIAVSSGAVQAAQCAPISVDARVLLSGPYVPETGLMGDALRTSGELPTTEPYRDLGFIMRGGEASTLELGDPSTSGPSSFVDWMLFELRDPADPRLIIATDTVPVERDGDLARSLSFTVPSGDYYLAVEHRNHLGVMTEAPISLTSGTIPMIDFTDPATPVWDRIDVIDGGAVIDYHGVERQIIDGVAVLWPGDADHDGRSLFDGSGDDDPAVVENAAMSAPENILSSPSYIVPAYVGSDLNLDGNAIYQGQINDPTVTANAVFLFPLNITNDPNYPYLIEQLPLDQLGEARTDSCELPTTQPSLPPASDPRSPKQPILANTGFSIFESWPAVAVSLCMVAAGLVVTGLRRRGNRRGSRS
ncbi:hypothetical protein QCD70_10000 [Agreia sp. PsM10]|uniref:hypothetical protein n=1 Tax=Agreia sp. PsM10 TaxID=3030533 RepID=UPI00263B2BBB|nr:hypothetical protein [Agreia sp. PsM10]MDN4640574.1 hypothetical protein [Agreia sp. PsM10]